ncbi:MAG: amino acid adenylation domain-containing protein [Waddliaceae bacterium]
MQIKNLTTEINWNIQKYPHKTAMVYNGKVYSYQDLGRAVSRIASFLISRGCLLNDVVAVYSYPTPEALITMIGILQAGGTVLPIDPVLPMGRIRDYVEDSQPKWLIFFNDEVEYEYFDSHLLLSYFSIHHHGCQKIALNRACIHAQIAYILYTSGSTGKPKGVKVSLQGFSYFMDAITDRLTPSSSTSILSITSLSFDISLLELFLPLVNGGQVVFTPPKTAANPEELISFLDSTSVNMVQATPSIWELIRTWGWQGNPKLTLLSGGEPLTESLARYLLKSSNSLWNLYGPTETIIWSSAKQLHPGFSQITVGVPLRGYHYSIRDKRGLELPKGKKGELYISGEGLAEGYHNDLKSTNAGFVGIDGVRYYKTGDYATQLSDGDYIVSGRIDRQVKIRGYRIELGEVESIFSKIQGVRQCVVQSIKNPSGSGQHLVVFWIAENELVENSGENGREQINKFREQLSRSLPSYMIPNKFFCVESFPLLTNGKIDYNKFSIP